MTKTKAEKITLIKAIKWLEREKALPYREILRNAVRFKLLKGMNFIWEEVGNYVLKKGYDGKSGKPYVQIFTKTSWKKYLEHGQNKRATS